MSQSNAQKGDAPRTGHQDRVARSRSKCRVDANKDSEGGQLCLGIGSYDKNKRILFAEQRVEPLSHSYQVSERACMQFFHDSPAMNLYGDFTYAETLCGFFICQTGNDEIHHFAFSRRECFIL